MIVMRYIMKKTKTTVNCLLILIAVCAIICFSLTIDIAVTYCTSYFYQIANGYDTAGITMRYAITFLTVDGLCFIIFIVCIVIFILINYRLTSISERRASTNKKRRENKRLNQIAKLQSKLDELKKDGQ